MAKKSTKSVEKEIERVFYGDCPRCGASLKGQSFAYIYETEAKKQKLIKKFCLLREKKTTLAKYIQANIDTVELNDAEKNLVQLKTENHLPLTNQSLLASVVDKKDTFYCMHCGYTFTLQYEKPGDGTQEEQKKEPKKKQK